MPVTRTGIQGLNAELECHSVEIGNMLNPFNNLVKITVQVDFKLSRSPMR